MKALLIRIKYLSNEKQTCGRFVLIDDDGELLFHAASLELPFKNNLPQISCIPTGAYWVKKTPSARFGKDTFEVMAVPGRSSIRIHQGNYTREIEGCILLGERFSDIDNDDVIDVVNSREYIHQLKKLTDEFELKVLEI